ncbi:MAG TPA: hypothetical protein VF389_11785 [Woeseiaceae bacterium]
MSRRSEQIRSAQRTAFYQWLSGASDRQLTSMTAERANKSYGLPVADAERLLSHARRRTNVE